MNNYNTSGDMVLAEKVMFDARDLVLNMITPEYRERLLGGLNTKHQGERDNALEAFRLHNQQHLLAKLENNAITVPPGLKIAFIVKVEQVAIFATVTYVFTISNKDMPLRQITLQVSGQMSSSNAPLTVKMHTGLPDLSIPST